MLITLVDYWKKHHSNILVEAEKFEKMLKAKSSPEEWTKMSKIVQKTMEATQKNYNKPRKPRTLNQEGREQEVYQKIHLQEKTKNQVPPKHPIKENSSKLVISYSY